MSIKNASVMEGATGISATAGTAVSLVSLSDSDDTNNCQLGTGDFLSSTNVTFKATQAKRTSSPSAPNGYTQKRSSFLIKTPLVLDNGAVTVNTIRVELAFDPETASSEVDELRFLAAQMLGDTDFDNFWRLQALS